MTGAQKITFGEMREMGVRGLLINCSDYRCSHWIAISGDQWAEAARRTVSGFETTQHMITNHVITVDGDKALCVAYLQAQHYLPNEQGDSTQTIGGYYTNHFIRTPHGWKIKSCKLTMTWSKGNWGIFELARQRLKAIEENASTKSR